MAIKAVFIGAGAMGGAILRGALANQILQKEEIYIVEHRQETCDRLQAELGVQAGLEMPGLETVDTIVFAVKPQVLPSVLKNMGPVDPSIALVSIAAGITLNTLQSYLPSPSWYRAMPNTPVMVNGGMTALTAANTDNNLPEKIKAIFASIGTVVIVTEEDLDRLGALCGSGPGFLFVLMDAMADAGVQIGLPRQLAIQAAVETFYGAGLLAKETKEHPSVLRDQVTSPGGTTIAGITAMEKEGARTAIKEAILAAYKKTKEIGK